MKVRLESSIENSGTEEWIVMDNERIVHFDGREWGPGTEVNVTRVLHAIDGSDLPPITMQVLHGYTATKVTIDGETVTGPIKRVFSTS